MKSMFGTAALALLLAGCGGDQGNGSGNAVATQSAPLPKIAAPHNASWTDVVIETAEGGYRMGNPDAPVKLVEYASITCHVCAEFSEQGSEPLRNQYVSTGQVSWEYRPFMLFPTDPGIFALLRCRGAGPFFQLTDQLYVDQENWTQRLQSMSPELQQQLQTMAPTDSSAALVRTTGIDQFFRQRGMPQATINSCLADQQALQRLVSITEQGGREGVTGTPTFFINGQRVENTTNWATLEPRLRGALGQ